GSPRAPRALRGGRGRRRAARRVERDRAALGQSALRLAAAARDGLPLVDRALPPHLRARRRRAHRPLPRLRRLLGGAGAQQDGARRPLAAWAWTGALRRRPP